MFRPESADPGNGEEMARAPMILALANPEPEILPPWRKKCVRMPSSAPVVLTIQTGQQRPLLPVHLPWRAGRWRTAINEEMKLAAVRAIAELAHPNRAKWWLQRMAIRI